MDITSTPLHRFSDNKAFLSLFAVLFWLLLGGLFLAQAYFYSLSTGQQMDWARQGPYRLSGYLLWGLLTIPLWQLFCVVQKRFSVRVFLLLQLVLSIVTGGLHRIMGTLLEFIIRWLAFDESSSISSFFEVRRIALLGGTLDSAVTYLTLILAFIAISAVLRNQQQRQKIQQVQQQLAQSKLAALQSQLQPHFLFNTLNGVVAAIHSAPLKAEAMVTQLARILRFSLDHSAQNTVPLKDEIKVIEDYLSIEKARLGERIAFDIAIESHCQQLPVPPLITQPLVENAVRHGIVPFNRPGQIIIKAQMDEDNGSLTIIIEDSGTPIHAGSSKGVGLSNCISRLQVLFAQRASLRFSQSALGGTKVELRLPVSEPPEATYHSEGSSQ